MDGDGTAAFWTDKLKEVSGAIQRTSNSAFGGSNGPSRTTAHFANTSGYSIDSTVEEADSQPVEIPDCFDDGDDDVHTTSNGGGGGGGRGGLSYGSYGTTTGGGGGNRAPRLISADPLSRRGAGGPSSNSSGRRDPELHESDGGVWEAAMGP
eukprot:Filipodium_phascolosomae@DN5681_c0_g1_i1.p1